MTEPILSIIIPTQIKRVRYLDRLLTSINEQQLSRGQLEVIIVSAHFSESISNVIESRNDNIFLYLQSGSFGVNKLRNLGFEHSRGKIIYFLDDDCRLPRADFLSNILLWHEQNPAVAGAGGYYLQGNSDQLVAQSYRLISQFWIVLNKVNSNTPWQLYGGNASYKKCFMPQTMPFNEKIMFGGTEEDFNQQFISKGQSLKIIATHSVYHDVCLSIADLCRKAFWQGHAFGERKSREMQAEAPFFKETLGRHINTKYSGYKKNIIIFYVWLYNYFFHFGADYYSARQNSLKFSIVRIFLNYVAVQIFRSPKLLRLRTFASRQRDSFLWKIIWPAVSSVKGALGYIFGYGFAYPLGYTRAYLLRLRTFASRQLNFLLWQVLWPALFPIRKVYYFIRYQIHKRSGLI